MRWAARVRNTENNVELRIGDGLCGTITGLVAYDLRFADPQEGQVGLYGVVEETTDRSPFALRLKVENGAVAEVELIVTRKQESGTPFCSADLVDKPVLNEILPEGQRRSRQEMIDIANGYFDTLQLNDGTLHTPLLSPNSRLGCADQFRLGQYRYDDRLRDRRHPLVDEERGPVLAGASIDHSGRTPTRCWSCSRSRTAPSNRSSPCSSPCPTTCHRHGCAIDAPAAVERAPLLASGLRIAREFVHRRSSARSRRLQTRR